MVKSAIFIKYVMKIKHFEDLKTPFSEKDEELGDSPSHNTALNRNKNNPMTCPLIRVIRREGSECW
jgi:hypothetical protein